jgi:hypothetical protein
LQEKIQQIKQKNIFYGHLMFDMKKRAQASKNFVIKQSAPATYITTARHSRA